MSFGGKRSKSTGKRPAIPHHPRARDGQRRRAKLYWKHEIAELTPLVAPLLGLTGYASFEAITGAIDSFAAKMKKVEEMCSGDSDAVNARLLSGVDALFRSLTRTPRDPE